MIWVVNKEFGRQSIDLFVDYNVTQDIPLIYLLYLKVGLIESHMKSISISKKNFDITMILI